MSAPRKILIVVLDNLGDAVMASAVFRPLLLAFPGVRLGLWAKEYAAGVFDDHSALEWIHASDPPWDVAPGRPKGDWKKFWKTLKEIKKNNYDAALVLNAEWRRALSVFWVGVPKRFGVNRRKSALFLNHKMSSPGLTMAPTDVHLALAERMTGRKAVGQEGLPRMEPTEAQTTWGKTFVKKMGWENAPLVAMHPFSGDALKNWPVENWFELMRLMKREKPDARFVLTCAPGERSRLDQEAKMTSQSNCQIISQTYFEMKGVFSQCHLFIGGDSGPGHVAGAMGKPVLSLFGPTDPRLYGVRGPAPIRTIKTNPLTALRTEEVKKEALDFLQALSKEKNSVG